MTPVERIKRMLETEQQTRARYAKEITSDPPLVRAEIRAGCLEEVLRLFDPGTRAAEEVANVSP